MRGSEKQPHLTCSKCAFELCFNCNRKWHGKLSCDRVVDDEFEKWAKTQDVKKCPRCRSIINKSEGCNHMTCGRCRYQFCWLCGAPYTEFHFLPWNAFGCGGLQYSNATQWGFWKRWGWRLLLFILCCLAAPFVIAFGFPAFCVYKFHDSAGWSERQSWGCCGKMWRYSLIWLLGMIGNAVVAPLAVAAVVPATLVMWCYMRYQNWKNSRNVT